MKLKHVSFKHILEDFSYETDAKRVAVLGPSGAGKTTLLRVLCGLEAVQGEVETVQAAMAFQEPRLIPWLSAKANLALVMGEAEAGRWLKAVGLEADGAKRPAALSGGMCQRLSLARALGSSGVLVLDEPFQGIDSGRKETLKRLIAKREELLLVTHDVASAVTLCDEILLVEGPPLRVVSVCGSREPDVVKRLEHALLDLGI